MSLTFGLNSFGDLRAKLDRDATKLTDEEVSVDNFFNFVVTGYSMIDWIKNDPAVPLPAKQDVQSLYSDPWIRICGDLANASKHFVLTKRSPAVATTTVEQGFGVGRFGMGGWGVGEQAIQVTLSDGSSYDCLAVVNGVINSWRVFCSTHGV